MTPSTISSLIPSKSITRGFEESSESSSPGEGGGVCSYLTSRDIGGDAIWERFTFFATGISDVGVAVGGEGRAARFA